MTDAIEEHTIWNDPLLDDAARLLRTLLEAKAKAKGTGLKTLLILAVSEGNGTSVNFEGCACPKCAQDIKRAVDEIFQPEPEVDRADGPVWPMVH